MKNIPAGCIFFNNYDGCKGKCLCSFESANVPSAVVGHSLSMIVVLNDLEGHQSANLRMSFDSESNEDWPYLSHSSYQIITGISLG